MKKLFQASSKVLFGLAFFTCLFTSCQDKPKGKILGKIKNAPENIVLLQFLTFESTETIDTSRVDSSGNFDFSKTLIKEPGFYGFRFGHNYWITVLDTGIENIKIEIDGQNNDYSSLKSDDKGSIIFRNTLLKLEGLYSKQDSLYRDLDRYKKLNLDDRQVSDSLDNFFGAEIIQLLKNAKDPFSKMYLSFLLNSSNEFELINTIYNDVFEQISNSSIYTKQLSKRLERLKTAKQQKDNLIKKENVGIGIEEIYDFNTIEIGKQVWMAENLNIATKGSWCLYDKDENCDIYGRIYNWFSAIEACPVGWKLPTDKDWKELELYLGAKKDELDIETWRGKGVGGKLKATSKIWDAPNKGANNESGFNALPGGPRNKLGMYGAFGHNATFWTATETNEHSAIFRYLGYSRDDIARSDHFKTEGHSVRCIKVK